MSEHENEWTSELQALLSDLLDGKLSDEGLERLREVLRDNPAAQDEYRGFMALHALLHLDFSQGQVQLLPPVIRLRPMAESSDQPLPTLQSGEAAGSASGLVPPSADRWSSSLRSWVRRGRTKVDWQLAGAITAVAASTLFVVWQLLPQGSLDFRRDSSLIAGADDDRLKQEAAIDPTAVDGVRPVAVLGQASRASWTDKSLPLNNGASLLPGKFKLEKGLVQIEMYSGASVVIEAPAEFELISPRRIACNLGKIRANVPSPATGFTIATPTYSAIDLGTEFTVEVEPTGESQFQVLDGEVDLRADRKVQTGVTKRLTTGQGVRSTAAGELSQMTPSESDFVGTEELLGMAMAARRERYDDWKRFSEQMSSAPNVVLYYGFDGHAPWERVLRNNGTKHSELLNGAIVGCQWTDGRWSGKQALEFKRTSDRVRLDVPGEFESLTFAAWLRIEGLERWLSSLMLTDGHQPGEVHWQMTDTGQLLLGVKAEPDKSHDFYSPAVIGPKDLGRWVHLACVYNGKEGYVSHCVDGAEVSREAVTIPTRLRIGAAEIGNWVPQDLRSYRIRSLNGRVDEFILFDSPLTTGEIHSIYEAGQPQS